jgi:hypothetical protein
MAKYIVRSCRQRKSWRLALVLIFTFAGGTAASASLARAAQEQLPNITVASKKPNIIFVLADDLNTELMNRLPRLRSLLAEQGTTVSNFFVNLALCCPSRASILRGQYAHNTQIFTNAPPGGGFENFRNLGARAVNSRHLAPRWRLPDCALGQVPEWLPVNQTRSARVARMVWCCRRD